MNEENDRVEDSNDQSEPELSDGKQLLIRLYCELRQLAEHRLAKESPGQTLTATALVHETFLRLRGSKESPLMTMPMFIFVATWIRATHP